MKFQKTLIITTILCLLPILMGVILYDQMPAQIATHFNSQGVPNDYSPKEFAVFGLPVFLAVMNILVHGIIAQDLKKDKMSKILNEITKWIAPIISLIINPLMYLIAIK